MWWSVNEAVGPWLSAVTLSGDSASLLMRRPHPSRYLCRHTHHKHTNLIHTHADTKRKRPDTVTRSHWSMLLSVKLTGVMWPVRGRIWCRSPALRLGAFTPEQVNHTTTLGPVRSGMCRCFLRVRVSVCECVCTDANVGGLSGRRGGWEEEEELDFGGRGFLGRRVGREGLGMSPTFTSSPTHKYTHTHKIIQPEKKLTDLNTQVWHTHKWLIRRGEGSGNRAAAAEVNLIWPLRRNKSGSRVKRWGLKTPEGLRGKKGKATNVGHRAQRGLKGSGIKVLAQYLWEIWTSIETWAKHWNLLLNI